MSLRDLDSTYVKIDLDAMLDNLSAISEKAGTMVLAVIKADAYGHGAVEVAKALESHCAFFVGAAAGQYYHPHSDSGLHPRAGVSRRCFRRDPTRHFP